MSLESLLNEEPGAILFRSGAPQKVDGQGKPVDGLGKIDFIQGRFVALNADQIEAWRTKAVKATYEFITQDDRVRNGDFLQAVEDDRLFRVTSVGDRVYRKGSIPTFYKHAIVADGRSQPGTT